MFVHFLQPRIALRWFLLAVLAFSLPASAEDAVHPQRVAAHRASSDPCIVYTYDGNGNRQSQTITVSGDGMTPSWGTGTWGCFKWTP